MTILKFRKPAQHGLNARVNFPSLVDELFRSSLWTDEFANFVPAVNISETKDSFIIGLSVPGFRKEDIKVKLENDLLTISGEFKKEEEKKEETFSHKEYSRGSFKRSFRLPENADTENVEAKQENGILRLTISKKIKKEENGAKEISIS
jgi:HSP20 family protein